MSTPLSSGSYSQDLAKANRAREFFIGSVAPLLRQLTDVLSEKLSDLLNETRSAREMQVRRDAWIAFPKIKDQWVTLSLDAWRKLHEGATTGNTAAAPLSLSQGGGLSLIEDDSVEDKIISSRMALRILDKVNWELNDLNLRIKTLERTDNLSKRDVLRPESLCTVLVDQWVECGLERAILPLISSTIQEFLAEKLPEVYKQTNEQLVKQGVMEQIDLRSMVRRTPGGSVGGHSQFPNSNPASEYGTDVSGYMSQYGGGMVMPAGMTPSGFMPSTAMPASGLTPAVPGMMPMPGVAGMPMHGNQPGMMPMPGMPGGAPLSGGGMLMAPPPRFGFSMASLRSHAQNVVSNVKRVFSERVGMPNLRLPQHTSEHLVQALVPAQYPGGMMPVQQGLMVAVDYENPPPQGYTVMHVERAQEALREESTKLKALTDEKTEKAIIEMVALIFQNIINEERISPGMRIWIARLQMPVLRLALAEPEFFESLEHPARKLIDHIGSCVLGFGAGDAPTEALEQEVKRIVQVIEQYPETGKRVFELVYDEFLKFLEVHLPNQTDQSKKAVSLAQQVEEKETLVIQYTIEMREQLGKMPIRDGIREFLFKVWSQVLAVSAVKFGAQSDQTLQYKQVPADLVWAASAKPSRSERQRVIADVPRILAKLRAGMNLLGYGPEEQNPIISDINATLTDAFMSKTEPIEQGVLDVLSERLRHLEDYVSDAEVGDIPLDSETIEMVLGMDTTGLNLITGDGAPNPEANILEWIKSLVLGSWHRLDHDSRVARVQFCWRSDMGQLFLFLTADGEAFLFQLRGLAGYLSAGLLLPAEEEALTMIATREALTKIEINPNRMF